MIFKYLVFYLLRTLADMAEKEQQIKGLKLDVLEKDRNITGEKKSLCQMGLMHFFAVSVIHTVFGVKYTIMCLIVVLY